MDVVFSLLVAFIWGYICYRMAKNRGRDVTIAAVLGALFGVFAVIGYAIAGDKNPPFSGAY